MDEATKRKLVSMYKETFKPPGVLIIRNKINNKIFINASLDVNKLKNRQLCELKSGNHMNKKLQRDWQQYGAENFTMEVVEEIKQQSEPNYNYAYAMQQARKRWLQKLNPYGDNGYH